MKDHNCYTVQEVAELFECHEETVWRKVRKKEIKATKFGQNTWIHKEELQDYLKGNRRFNNVRDES